MSVDRQLDFFSVTGLPTDRAAPDLAQRPPLLAEKLADDVLIAAIRDADLANCHALAGEAGRRKLAAAVPALEALCRRFKGFGLHHAVSEQTAALQGLAAIGGLEAAATVIRIIVERVVQGPGLSTAIGAAVALRCRLPPDIAAALLRHPDPDVRANTARCAPPQPEAIALMVDLLHDLNSPVAKAAACALGRMGRPESRQILVRLLREEPSPEVIDAVISIADEVCIVMLGRIARGIPDLADYAVAALDDINDPRAATVASTLQRASAR